MKKTTFFLILMFSLVSLLAQQTGQTIDLNQQITGGQHTYVASQEITLLPGFQYIPGTAMDYLEGKIDPFMVIPPEDGELIGGAENNNEGGVVGTMPGNLMVSPSGAAVYNIPIQLPAGVNGMTPQIGLVYNSQGGNGLLGWGWSLSGLSAVTRTGTTIYHNGYIDGVDFDGNDEYMLDGQRLIAVNDQKTEFRTEIETFSKIQCSGTAGDGPMSFVVKTKSGQTLYYGTDATSRIEASGREAVLFWHLDKIEDQKGNYISFVYHEANGMGIIDKIQYGGNSNYNKQHFYEIQFDYQYFRNDIIRQFVAGSSIIGTDLLTGIQIKYQGQILNTYKLDYDQGMYSRLQKVWLYDGVTNGPHFNPVVADWGSDNGHANIELLSPTESAGTQYDQFLLDINGDGKTDIIKIEYEVWQPGPNLPGMKKALNWFFRLRSDDDTFLPLVEIEAGPLQWYRNLLVGDYNGDGLEDFIEIGYANNTPDRFYIDGVMISTGNGFEYYYLNDISGLFINNPEFRTGDFDGDGISELLAVYKNKIVNYDDDPNNDEPDVYIWKLNKTSPSNVLVFSAKMTFGNTDFDKSVIVVSDFNGDGRSDIFRTAEYGGTPHTSNCFIYNVDIPTNQLHVIYGTESNGYPTTWHQLYPADFNGDGITDLLTYTYSSDNPTWEIACFNGQTGFNTMTAPPLEDFNLYDQSNSWYYSLNLADYNGDGKTDIMQLHKIQNTSTAEYIIYYSNGNTFSETTSGIISMIGGLASGGVVQYEHVHPSCDFNGDGNADLYLQGLIYTGDFVELIDCDNKFKLIKSCKNGLGQITEMNYSSLTNPDTYSKGTGAIYPVVDIQPAFYVVESVLSENGIGGFNTNKYLYEGAKLHKTGKGFLGFQQLTTSNLQNANLKSKNISTYEIEPTHFFLWPSKTQNWINKENYGLVRIGETLYYDPVVKDFGSKRFFYYTPRVLTKNYSFESQGANALSTSLSIQSYSEADITYGNLSSNFEYMASGEKTLDSPTSEYDFNTINNYKYDPPNIGSWLIGLVNEVEIKKWAREDEANIIQQKINYNYYPGTSFVEFETLLPNNDEQYKNTSHYFYTDGYGNMTSVKLSAPGMEDRIVEYDFGAEYQHRFLTRKIKTLNNVPYIQSNYYDPQTGLIMHETDENNLSTYYEYDGFGRNEVIKTPDNILRKTKLYWSANHEDNRPPGLYYRWSQSSGTPQILTFYDQFGRELRTVTQDFHGNTVYLDKDYNSKGLLQRESIPYLKGTSELQYTEYTYDDLGRLTFIKNPDGKMNTVVYDGLSVSNTNANGQTTEKTTNVAGWLTQSKDPNGNSVQYSYFSDGKLKSSSIMDKPETTVSVEYNSRRQQKRLSDPNYGTVDYTYNAFDELVKQVSPKNEITSLVYDNFGRITSKTDVEGTTSWVYDVIPGKKGSLQSVSKNGHTTTYLYDALLRTISVTESVDGISYSTTFTYDALGRPKNTTHPSGFTTSNFYNNQGELYRIRSANDNTILWQTDEVSHLGQLNKYTLGNGFQTKQTYDPVTMRLENIETRYQTQVLQDLDFDWDDIGNLKSRTKWINRSQNQKLFEEFTYDALNRLSTITLNGELKGDHAYDPGGLGNMKYKMADGDTIYKSGEYGENQKGPHALTSATTYQGVFPEDEQIIVYNTFDKVTQITEGKKLLTISYGNHQQRIRQEYTDNGIKISKTWAGACEYINNNGNLSVLTYLSGPQGVFAVVEKTKTSENIFYIHKDHLGSWNTITDTKRNLVQELSFDAWGVSRDPNNWQEFSGTPPQARFDRGFTGHEHLYGFNLINMNGRVYDPVVSRMLSPDNYIQSPDFTQSFNRYSYCVNNPLKYTDPSGELYLWDDIIVGGVGFAYGYVNYGLTHGDWGWNAVGAGCIGAGVALLSYYTAGGFGLAAGGSASGGAAFAGNYAFSSVVNSFMPSFNVPITDNFSVSMSIGLGVSVSGIGAGFNISGNYSDVNFSASLGFGSGEGATGSYSGWGASVRSSESVWGIGYNRTSYSGAHSQVVGGSTLFLGKNTSFRLENDFFGDRHDRWRSNAFELSIGDFVLGSNLYNNDVYEGLSDGQKPPTDDTGMLLNNSCNRLYKGKQLGAWANGQTYSSPLWVGFKANGQVHRFGYSHELVQDRTQNVVHKWFGPGRTNFFNKYDNFNRGTYNYYGYDNPYSLW